VWDKPVLEPCPKCGAGFVTEKVTKRYGIVRKCPREECDWVFQPELAEGNVLPLPERREAASRRPARTSTAMPPPGKKVAASARRAPMTDAVEGDGKAASASKRGGKARKSAGGKPDLKTKRVVKAKKSARARKAAPAKRSPGEQPEG
jgi:hypothetical protein